ncbi:MAG TPA: hypothetical protein VMV01_13215 [Planctomycetota bacterium]|jgi:hypothetical protein|nr:hypothetical protein [Planctomycetota bacterium]
MRKAFFAVATLSTLALPGCIFAYGTDRDDWDDNMSSSSCCSSCEQMEHAEKRLSLIEHHLKGDCKANCPFCKPGETAESKAEAPAAK